MRKILLPFLLTLQTFALADDSQRALVEMPPMMRTHMLANMRDHLAALNEILTHASRERWEQAAEIAEQRLGMSSLDDHAAEHMGRFMPEDMARIGLSMHRAATAFALSAEEGDTEAAWKDLAGVTAACVSCHAAYRVH